MKDERMSFDEAARDLGLTEEELEQLVAAGEIATIKEGDTLYLKKEVVRKFKEKRADTDILLSDDEISLLDDDAVEEIDLLGDDDEGTTPVKPAATAKPARKEAADIEEISLDDVPSLDLDSNDELASISLGDEAPSAAGEATDDETLLNMDSLLEDDSEATTPVPDDATLLDTDLLDLSGESDPFSADTAEETSAEDLTEAGTLLRSGGARVMQMKRKSGHPWPTVALGAVALLLLLPLGVLVNVIFASSEATKNAQSTATSWVTEYNFMDSMVESAADMFKPTNR